MAPFEGAVEPYPRNSLAIRGESEVEQRHAGAVLEITAAQRLFEAVTSIDALGSVEVDLPEIGSLNGMVSLEANA
jgi:hypothetical protein